MLFAVLVAASLAAWLWYRRSNELFCISVRSGKAIVVRGRVPGALLSDFREALARSNVVRGTVRGVRDMQRARLAVSGAIDDGCAQQLRNIFAIYPLSRLQAAPSQKQRNVGQVLGLAWLAWLLHRSSGGFST